MTRKELGVLEVLSIDNIDSMFHWRDKQVLSLKA